MRHFLWICALSALAGCAHAPAAGDSNLAHIRVDQGSAEIDALDGKAFQTALGPAPATKLDLAPGEHTIGVGYRGQPDEITTWFLFRLVAEAGHTYLIRSDVSLWTLFKHQMTLNAPPIPTIKIVDANKEDADVGESIESFGERFTGANPIQFDDLFTWEPPVGITGMGLSRFRSGRAVTWTPTWDEIYSVAITTFAVQNVQTSDDFATLVRKRRENFLSATLENRTEELEDSIEPFNEGNKLCERFRHRSTYRGKLHPVAAVTPGTASTGYGTRGDIAEDLLFSVAFQSRLASADRVMLESYGYDCVSPTKKDLGIHFEYTRRSEGQPPDGGMASAADTYFEQLKF